MRFTIRGRTIREPAPSGEGYGKTREDITVCEALRELMKDEIEAARKEGWKEGWEEGWKEGWKEGITEAIYSLVSEGDISPEKGAQELGISVEQLNSDMSASATPRRL